jgi:CDP-paratose 2-epimerase
LQTNLMGTLNCLELARRDSSQFIFLSTSRVYPIKTINSVHFIESETRFELSDQVISGASKLGYSESFPLDGVRSLYGATKLASELIFQEYIEYYQIRGVINRCGVLTGAWQMGKVDQGVIVYWMANHIFQKPLSYYGYGGTGKQVRDILHVSDLYELIKLQLNNMDKCNGQIYNIGGGREVSISLLELTSLCFELSKIKIPIQSIPEDRISDIRIYLSDISKVSKELGWKPKQTTYEILLEIYKWIFDNKKQLKPIFG